jgi:hypothetical protein
MSKLGEKGRDPPGSVGEAVRGNHPHAPARSNDGIPEIFDPPLVDLAEPLQKKFGVQTADRARAVVFRALDEGLTWSSKDPPEEPA